MMNGVTVLWISLLSLSLVTDNPALCKVHQLNVIELYFRDTKYFIKDNDGRAVLLSVGPKSCNC